MSQYSLQRALEIIISLNPNTTDLDYAKMVATRALDEHKNEIAERGSLESAHIYPADARPTEIKYPDES